MANLTSPDSEFRSELGAVLDLSARTKLRITGADRLRYLNGQISNDLRKASEISAIHACVLNVKGKVDADVFIAADGDSFVLDTNPDLSETLIARLDRYIIADDVQVEDVTDAFALYHVVGGEEPVLSVKGKSRAAIRFGTAGIDIWVDRALHEVAWLELSRALPVMSDEDAEILRVELGLPRWNRELTGEIIPTEANLENIVVDFAKGCYIGQEVISRIKMSGQTNKRLCGLSVAGPHALPAGWRLVAPEEQKDVGWITSSVVSPRYGRIALGFLKRGFQAAGLQLQARPAEGARERIAVTVVPLPFASRDRSPTTGEAD
ncbi:MAG: glycine cleavage T C-terminal barrel domain-containing protein [Chthoniobacterales bacterium]